MLRTTRRLFMEPITASKTTTKLPQPLVANRDFQLQRTLFKRCNGWTQWPIREGRFPSDKSKPAAETPPGPERCNEGSGFGHRNPQCPNIVSKRPGRYSSILQKYRESGPTCKTCLGRGHLMEHHDQKPPSAMGIRSRFRSLDPMLQSCVNLFKMGRLVRLVTNAKSLIRSVLLTKKKWVTPLRRMILCFVPCSRMTRFVCFGNRRNQKICKKNEFAPLPYSG